MPEHYHTRFLLSGILSKYKGEYVYPCCTFSTKEIFTETHPEKGTAEQKQPLLKCLRIQKQYGISSCELYASLQESIKHNDPFSVVYFSTIAALKCPAIQENQTFKLRSLFFLFALFFTMPNIQCKCCNVNPLEYMPRLMKNL